MMLLTYDQSVTFFKTKYGLVSGSYFMDASFTQTNPNIKKTNAYQPKKFIIKKVIFGNAFIYTKV